MIKTVIFDLGGVIVPLDFPRLYREVSKHCAIASEEIPKRIATTSLVDELETGAITGEEFSVRIGELLGLSLSKREFQQVWNALFPPHTLIPESLLETLRRNYRLLLLSNTNSLHFEMICENYPLLRHFDDLVLSYKVGAMKPSPKIYDAALARADAQPEECFYTDDVQKYVDAAVRHGWNAVQFRSFEELKRDFERYGIRCYEP